MVIYDPRKFVKVVEFIQMLGLKYLGVTPDTVDIKGVVIVDDGGIEYLTRKGITVNGPILRLSENLACTVLKAAVAVCKGDVEVRELTVGIDFGRKVGVAVITDSIALTALSFRSIYKALEFIITVLQCLEASKKVVRIGIPRKEDPEYDDFVNKLINLLSSDIGLELVSERGSSKSSTFLKYGKKLDEDALAAINIALGRSE
ncbi:MAG TPA: hypothetical protein EYH02_05170 [Ignisphaera aggregans]|uniref:Uncharacterized protein n=1 Tax=Ignisphaera aggregans TaxID=334771 RepID=A0A833DUQ6_9CREN|nr:hypothetical protein [Ignisphaera aggregans]